MIIKTRREKFGGIVFFEKPGFVGYVNSAMADAIGIKKNRNAHYIDAVFPLRWMHILLLPHDAICIVRAVIIP